MKKILFVMNTMGQAGAEMALLELLRRFDEREELELSLFVLMAQGEMINRLPENVRLMNPTYCSESVLSSKGRKKMVSRVLATAFHNLSGFRNIPYMLRGYYYQQQNGQIKKDKLLWRVLSDGSEQLKEEYDLAVAYLEGGATYYVHDHVKAARKAAFVHVDYNLAGYTRALDKECYLDFDRIFGVSEEVREAFLQTYPECESKTYVFPNLIGKTEILRKCHLNEDTCPYASESASSDSPLRLLTVGRLETQKAYEVSIEAMRIVKDRGVNAVWTVLGEGAERASLERLIEERHLSDSFLLPGATDNPYVYMKNCDIYVHCSRFEGKSIAIQEAQILGCCIIASDCSGNREQLVDGEGGLLVDLLPERIADAICTLAANPDLRKKYSAVATNTFREDDRTHLLLELAGM